MRHFLTFQLQNMVSVYFMFVLWNKSTLLITVESLYLVVIKVSFSKVVYIEKFDFRMKDSKDYYGLAPGKSVLLRCLLFSDPSCSFSPFNMTARLLNMHLLQHRYAFPIKCTEVILGDNDTILEVHAEYDPSKKTKPKVAQLIGKCSSVLNVLIQFWYSIFRGFYIGSRNLCPGPNQFVWKWDCSTNSSCLRLEPPLKANFLNLTIFTFA